MIRKIIFCFTFIMLTNCGYEPIYIKNDTSNFSIQKFILSGDKNINRRITSLLNLKSKTEENSQLILRFNSKKLLEVVSKDKAGNALIYKITVSTNVQLNENEKLIKEKNFRTSFTYNNSENKFELLQYQKNIETNLVDKITEEINIFLNT